MKILAGVSGMAGVIVIAGNNALLALGLGLVAMAVYLVVVGIVERLERIELAVDELRHQADAERLHAGLAHKAGDRPSAEARGES